ncbi:hypothetical protein B484DRAFT_439529 [Ochromonadaceae sp. CCMP2298]|nr:hypothetical protein B484DRAFT_439529 [Ochromonadaceae sp. CCMP2298]
MYDDARRRMEPSYVRLTAQGISGSGLINAGADTHIQYSTDRGTGSGVKTISDPTTGRVYQYTNPDAISKATYVSAVMSMVSHPVRENLFGKQAGALLDTFIWATIVTNTGTNNPRAVERPHRASGDIQDRLPSLQASRSTQTIYGQGVDMAARIGVYGLVWRELDYSPIAWAMFCFQFNARGIHTADSPRLIHFAPITMAKANGYKLDSLEMVEHCVRGLQLFYGHFWGPSWLKTFESFSNWFSDNSRWFRSYKRFDLFDMVIIDIFATIGNEARMWPADDALGPQKLQNRLLERLCKGLNQYDVKEEARMAQALPTDPIPPTTPLNIKGRSIGDTSTTALQPQKCPLSGMPAFAPTPKRPAPTNTHDPTGLAAPAAPPSKGALKRARQAAAAKPATTPAAPAATPLATSRNLKQTTDPTGAKAFQSVCLFDMQHVALGAAPCTRKDCTFQHMDKIPADFPAGKAVAAVTSHHSAIKSADIKTQLVAWINSAASPFQVTEA